MTSVSISAVLRAAELAELLRARPEIRVLDVRTPGEYESAHIRGTARLSLERQARIAAGALAATGAILALTINPLFAILPAFIGSGLVFAGITDWCGMALLLARLPYNRPAACDVGAMVRALREGASPSSLGRVGAASGPAARSCSVS